MQAQLAKQEARTEELSNQVFVLTDRVDAVRVQSERAAVPPDLKVIRLLPEPESPARASSPETLQVVEVPPPPRPRLNGNAERLFRDALAAYREGTLAVALQRFTQFRESFPEHAYADNALYWMGECRYDAKDYPGAILEWTSVVKRHPKSNKVPDALFKIGLAYEQLGEGHKARTAFRDLVAGFPKSAMADLARSHLDGGAP